jgi:hypothetical protein
MDELYSGGPISGQQSAEPFSIIVIPDIQYYTNSWPNLLTTMTTWIKDSRESLNTAFVLQEGDVTNTNADAEWNAAVTSFNVLDGFVPYAIAPGNHDGNDTALFNEHFPVSKFSGLPTFGGVFETGKMDNCYHLFSAGGADWIIIVLEYNPRAEALAWANGVAAAHPHRRAIVLTHAFLTPQNDYTGVGENIWNGFARLNGNVSFIFNGHYTDDTAGRLVSAGDKGNKVYQMYFNFQTYPFAGGGRLRIVGFDPAERKVSVKTYSPWTDSYETGDDHQFEFTDVDLGNP